MSELDGALQREIRQTRAFRSPAQEAALSVLRTADLIRRRVGEILEPFGVTTQQYNVLRILRGARGPVPTLDIAERMIERTPGVTRLLDRLEERGWVARERCREDRRRVLCTLTPAGEALLESVGDAAEAADEAVMAPLSAEEVASLLRMLARVRLPLR